MLHSLRQFNESDVAKQRMKMIKFYDQYGENATKQAFGADRKVISRWKQRLWQKDGKLSALVPCSTRPHRVRTSTVPREAIEFIRDLREEHPRLGKEKIKVFLDSFCHKNSLRPISISTIGKIIKRHHLFFQKSGRVYHLPDGKKAQAYRLKTKRLRIKHSPKNPDFGHIVADTVHWVTDGVKDYFYNAIDASMKFSFTLNYKRLSSRNMKDFFDRFKQVYPLPVRVWQSDNGPENLGEFESHLKQLGIPHFFSYPNCPKINTFVERYNRTLQEEFIVNHLDIINDKTLFHKALADYLIFYNTLRPHKSLDLKSPIQFLIQKSKMSHMFATHTFT